MQAHPGGLLTAAIGAVVTIAVDTWRGETDVSELDNAVAENVSTEPWALQHRIKRHYGPTRA
jgi:hypothetical protein